MELFHFHRGALKKRDIPVPWPAMLDLITSTLMVFMLVTTLQLVFGNDDMEAALTRGRQGRFVQEFQGEFWAEVASQEIRVEPHLNFIQIRFSDGVLFQNGEHHLQPAGQQLLRRCAQVFARAGGSGYEQIQVEGHTDDVPLDSPIYPTNNWELSTARALSVVEFLSGVDSRFAPVLSANGYSSNRPVADNKNPAGRKLNRRIEIRLFFSGTRSGSAASRGSGRS